MLAYLKWKTNAQHESVVFLRGGPSEQERRCDCISNYCGGLPGGQ